ncbi:MAG: hypothetical protein HYV63_19715 [Candidatus Schekmanbacteria bacterium]|nr:hypothetical protein [Candidatus Schekmanbacteria bacterium]
MEAWETPELLKAREELERLSTDPALRAVYEQRLLEVQLLASELRDAYDDGLEKGLERGRREGLLEAIELRLRLRFGEAGLALMPATRAVVAAERLERIRRALAEGATIEHLRALTE